jgi:hypothetical protein
VGAKTNRPHNAEAQRHAPDLQQDSTGPLERSSPWAPSPAASRAPSCRIVATTPEAEEGPEQHQALVGRGKGWARLTVVDTVIEIARPYFVAHSVLFWYLPRACVGSLDLFQDAFWQDEWQIL